MNRRVAEKWIKALKSGKYNQTHHCLKDSDGYCCLGVLCELAVKEGVIKPSRKNEIGFVFGRNSIESLPGRVLKWAGMKSDDGEIPYHCSLMYMNDNEHANFHHIANVINKYVKEL